MEVQTKNKLLHGKAESHVELGAERNIDYQKLTMELITQIRGTLSQRALSSQIGFSYNQVGKWESGSTRIKWSDFLLVTSAVGIQMNEVLSQYFGKPIDHICIENPSSLFLTSYGLIDLKNKKLLKKLHQWNLSNENVDLIEVLKIFDCYPSSLFGWLMLFADPSDLSSIRDRYEHFRLCVEAVEDDPTLIFVNAALQVAEYKEAPHHDEKILAKHSLLTLPQLQLAIRKMSQLSLIRFDGKKYHPDSFDFSFSNLRLKALRKFNKYTALIAGLGYPLHPLPIQNVTPVRSSNSSSTRVNAISSKAGYKIDELVRKFHNEITEIIRQDKDPKTHVQIVLLQSFCSSIIDPKKSIKAIEICDEKTLPGSNEINSFPL